MNYRDQNQLDKISEEFCRHLTADTDAGALNWQASLDLLVASFPGSFGVLLLKKSYGDDMALLWSGDIDPSATTSYSKHYASVNPWVDVWEGLPSGSVRISELHSPARQFRGTEFYEDWLRTLPNGEAAVGMKLYGSDDFLLHLPIHFDLKQCDAFNSALARVFARARSRLMEAIHAEKQYAQAYKHGSLDWVCRSSHTPVFVLDLHSKVYDFNASARRLIDESILSIQKGKLSINHRAANGWMATRLFDLRMGICNDSWRFLFQIKQRDLLLELVDLNFSSVSKIFEHHRYFALRIADIPFDKITDFELVAQYYHLTPAERRTLRIIASGGSVQECARQLGNTENTVRSTLKTIFDKTGTSRQGELVALCHQFSGNRI